jgi:multisubunit Na+/H+ antiporter MnhG subunit
VKNKKVELDLEMVLRPIVTIIIVLGVLWVGLSCFMGHAASFGQTLGAFLLLMAVYLLLPQKESEG